MTQETYDRVVRDGRRRRAALPGGAAVVVAGLVTAGVVLLPSDTATDRLVAADGSEPTASPTDCPATAERAAHDSNEPAAVPQRPQGFDGASSLLPDEVPSFVVVCRYEEVSGVSLEGVSFPPAALVAGRSLAGDLAPFAAAVAKPNEPESLAVCRDALGSATPVRVEVTYPSGARAWLSTERNDFGCRGIGNGLFVNHVAVGPQLLEAWDQGRWGSAAGVAPVSESDCPREAFPLPTGRGDASRYPVPAPAGRLGAGPVGAAAARIPVRRAGCRPAGADRGPRARGWRVRLGLP